MRAPENTAQCALTVFRYSRALHWVSSMRLLGFDYAVLGIAVEEAISRA
jgi:hypothetical protein